MASLASLALGPPKDVLFFGDSLTWGMAHKYTGRYDISWPRMLERRLNLKGYNMVESALCSRTTTLDDPGENDWLVGGEPHFFNGLSHFIPEFLSHECRCVVILLGTNDLKVRIRAQSRTRGRSDAQSIANACAKIGLLARQAHQNMQRLKDHQLTIVYVAPPPVRLNQLSRDLGYDEMSVKISQEFPAAYRKMCKENGFEFVEIKGIDMERSVDGVHVTPEASRQIAEATWKVLEKVLEKRSAIPSFTPVDPSEDDSDQDNDKGPHRRPRNNPPKEDNDSSSSEGGDQRNGTRGSRTTASGRNRQSANGRNGSRKTSSSEFTAGAQTSMTERRRMPLDSSDDEDESSSQGSHRSGNETDEDGKTTQRRKRRMTEDLSKLVWTKCKECGKWRRTTSLSSRKAHWTCRDDFYSERLEEWKTGCIWSADLPEGALPNDGNTTADVPTAGLVVSETAMDSMFQPLVLSSTLPVRRPEIDDQPAPIELVRLAGTVAKELGGGAGTSISPHESLFSPVIAAGDVAGEEGAQGPTKPRGRGRPPGSVNKTKGFPSQQQQGGMQSQQPQPSQKEKPRGRPPGSKNKPKAVITETLSSCDTTTAPTTSILNTVAPNSTGQTRLVPTATTMSPMAGKPTYSSISSSTSASVQTVMPTTMLPPASNTAVSQPLAITHPPTSLAVLTAALPPAPQPVIVQGTTMGMMTEQRQAPQQPHQQVQQPPGVVDVVKAQLAPFVESISASLPIQFQTPIQHYLTVLCSDQSPPTNKMQAFADLRQMFASYPHLVNEMDAIAHTHPVLGMCFIPTQPQYVTYWPTDPTMSSMQAMAYYPMAMAPPQATASSPLRRM